MTIEMAAIIIAMSFGALVVSKIVRVFSTHVCVHKWVRKGEYETALIETTTCPYESYRESFSFREKKVIKEYKGTEILDQCSECGEIRVITLKGVSQ